MEQNRRFTACKSKIMNLKPKMQISTKCVHSGGIPDKYSGGINSAIFTSSANEYLDREEAPYPRYFNISNQAAVAEKLASLENGEEGIVFSSGMAAITTSLLAFVKAGDHVVFQDEIYGGSHAFIEEHFDRIGIRYSLVGSDVSDFEEAITPETKAIYIETPTNPLLTIIDIRRIAKLAAKHKCLSFIDGTFATPINQKPLDLGIDVVVHSGTKYFGGHSDLCSGAVITRKSLAEKIRKTAVCYGGSLNAIDCYLLERSLKTLALRVEKQSQNALEIAQFLNDITDIKKVNYPGLENHPGHAIAKKQMTGFGAMLSFEIGNPKLNAFDYMKRLKLVKPAVSLGGVETTICDPATTSHAKVSAEVRQRMGITDGLLRLSVGIEDVEDIKQDLADALASTF